MNGVTANPRSVLHALPPYGCGTPQVESLVSYFCRLAASHSVSTLTLSRTIAERFSHDVLPNFDWHQRQISGIRESALTWSAALSALTSIQGLDTLTFLPWRDVISQNGLSVVSRGQFCPECFADDRDSGHTPYFRLAWESAEVTVCTRHRRHLTQHCQHCGKDNIRHAAAFVIPGWCTHCGEFLGNQANGEAVSAIDPPALWAARQVEELLASQPGLACPPSRDVLMTTITHLIEEMDNGKSAAFARRIGVGKSTIHHWFKGQGVPTLQVSLKISAHCGISLLDLFTGNLADWKPPQPEQMVLMLPSVSPKTRNPPRTLDWAEIEGQLQAFLKQPTPISVLEAARQLDVEARQLYLRANRTTRQLGERWKMYLKRRQKEAVDRARPYLESACLEIWAEGKAVTRREIAERVPEEILAPVENLLTVLKEVQAKIHHAAPHF